MNEDQHTAVCDINNQQIGYLKLLEWRSGLVNTLRIKLFVGHQSAMNILIRMAWEILKVISAESVDSFRLLVWLSRHGLFYYVQTMASLGS